MNKLTTIRDVMSALLAGDVITNNDLCKYRLSKDGKHIEVSINDNLYINSSQTPGDLIGLSILKV